MFQVTPDQEKTMLIGDMLSDGLLIVELLPSPSCTPAAESHPSILLFPEATGGARGTGNLMDSPSPMDSPSTAARKRKMFGRNTSYGRSTA